MLEIARDWSFETQDVAAVFDRHVREQLPFYELATDALSVVARHYVPRDGLVYDLGCSTGNVGRAMESVIDDRRAKFVPIDCSEAMRDAYTGPQRGNFILDDVTGVEFAPFDLAVLFLTLMFIPVVERPGLIGRLRRALKPGGALVVVDKTPPASGYAATVMWRMILSAKVAAGVSAGDVIAKELSLGGVQRPLDPAILGPDAVEWFRYGDFAGWLVET